MTGFFSRKYPQVPLGFLCVALWVAIALASSGGDWGTGGQDSYGGRDSHGGHDSHGPSVDMVPVVRTKVVPVEVEHSVGASDYVNFTVGPKTSVAFNNPVIIPDNFARGKNGEFAEGISIAGEISRTVQYQEGEAEPHAAGGDAIFAQIQVTSKDKKRESSVIREEINLANAKEERRVFGDPIIEIRRLFFLNIFIPYTQIRDVLYSLKGVLGKQVIISIVLVDAAGNILVGPGGAVNIIQTITIGSFFLPPILKPGIPWPVWSPIILIPRCPIPFPGGFTRKPTSTRIGTGGTAGQMGGAQPGRQMGGGTGTAGGIGQQAGTGQVPAGATIGGGSEILSSTLTVTVPAKKQIVFWFSLPEKDGDRHEVNLQLTNYSVGLGLANLSVIAKDQEKEYKRSRALIDTLPNVSVGLETGKPEELKTLDLSDKVAAIGPENRTYILVLAAPTIDENLVEIKLDPAWAKSLVFLEPSEMSLPTKILLAENKK